MLTHTEVDGLRLAMEAVRMVVLDGTTDPHPPCRAPVWGPSEAPGRVSCKPLTGWMHMATPAPGPGPPLTGSLGTRRTLSSGSIISTGFTVLSCMNRQFN